MPLRRPRRQLSGAFRRTDGRAGSRADPRAASTSVEAPGSWSSIASAAVGWSPRTPAGVSSQRPWRSRRWQPPWDMPHRAARGAPTQLGTGAAQVLAVPAFEECKKSRPLSGLIQGTRSQAGQPYERRCTMWMEQFDFRKALGVTAFLLSLAFLFAITLSPPL
jgi:hypothetical protein